MDAILSTITLEDFLKPEIIWFLIGIGLLIFEFAAPGLVIFFFGVGACIVSAVCLIYKDIGIDTQLIVFIVSSVLSLICLRKWLKGIFYGYTKATQDTNIDMDDFTGKKAIVIEKIDPKLGGKVEFNGTNWNAQSDSEISIGSAVEIITKENLTLKVKAL